MNNPAIKFVKSPSNYSFISEDLEIVGGYFSNSKISKQLIQVSCVPSNKTFATNTSKLTIPSKDLKFNDTCVATYSVKNEKAVTTI